ncbi:MAG: CerR family C-terminal domain-containing protein, partial [Planctomycetes bacterium]|nr:CerR family C-terminal domain-containing protein [Planctomycetota bacterium]
LLSHSLRLRALSFMGGLFVFRYGDATLLGILNRDEIAPRDMKLIKKTIGQMVTALERETDQ